ncbi:MAG: PAS domain-containing protein, partial [Candidatus Neomarinimicrobiota bacterium]
MKQKPGNTIKQSSNKSKDQTDGIESSLSSVMNAATDGFILFDSQLNHIEVNKAALEIMGLNRKDVTGKNIFDIVPEVKESGRFAKYKEVMRTGKSFFTPDLKLHTKFGDKRTNLRVFKVGNGLGIMITDITEPKATKELLKATEIKFRTSVENLIDPFGIYSAVRDESGEIEDFIVEYVNKAACKSNQMTYEEQVGKKLCEILPA